MALPISKINLNLDTNKPNVKIDEKFLQGNTDKTLYLKLLKNNEPVGITDGIKATIVLIFYNGSNVFKKYKISPKKDDGSDNANYTIPAVTNNEIVIPFTSDIAFVDHSGRTDLILYIEDGNNYYTYSCTYYVDPNEAYNSMGLIDNLPSIDNIKTDINNVKSKVATLETNVASNTAAVANIPTMKTDINTLKSDVASNTASVSNIPTIQSDITNLKASDTQIKASVTTNTNDITAAKTELTNKAAKDLSNVQGFVDAPDGSLLYKKNNQIKHTPITIDDTGKIINSPYSLKVPANTIELGDNIAIHENGGFIENSTKTLGQNYILLDYENDPTNGSKKPIYYERAAKRNKVDIQPIDSQTMLNVTSVDLGKSTQDKQVQAIYIKLVEAVTNLKFKININGNDVAYYPNKNAYDGNENGLNLSSGLQKIDLKPFWTTLTEYSTVITFKADTPIKMLGNGTIPYFAQDFNSITRKDIALMDDINSVDTSGSAKKDLTNVDNTVFEQKGISSGLLQQNLADVDITKLADKGHDAGLISSIKLGQSHGDYRSGEVKEIIVHNNLDLTFDVPTDTATISIADVYASKDISNVATGDMDKAIRLTNAYKQIANLKPEHDGVIARHIEEQGPIDFSTINEKLIHAVYQITSEQEVIIQNLPPLSNDKTIIIEVIMSSGISDYSHLTLRPNANEQINGANMPLNLSDKGILGVLIPEASNSWIWIPYPIMHDYGISVEDDKNNIHVGMQTLEFKGATLTTDQNDNKKSIITIDSSASSNPLVFEDTLSKKTFIPNQVKSTDKSIRIADLNGVADISKGIPDHNEGIHVCLGNDELLNSNYGKSKLYFSDTRIKGGMFVYPDNDTKSFVIQDVDPQDDPNISGGTTFIIALYYEPNPDESNIVTQDGQLVLELVDDNDIPINDTEGNPMGAVIDYKANDKIKPELYIGECKASAFTRVHLKIDLKFANEEIISVGANTQLCIQSITKEESSGLALLSFMAFTGYNINFDTKYYGYNSLNLAQFLTFDVTENNTKIQQMQFGNNTYLDFKANAKLSITNNHLIIKDDGVNPPIWSIIKYYDTLDSHSIGGKSYKVSTTLTDKDNAYRVGLLEYTGTVKPAPIPSVLRYQNENPIFTDGWVQRDSMFISEDAILGDHSQNKIFTIPSDPKGIAIIMYPQSSIPSTLNLKDLEGDITPWFNRVIITDNSHISERYLQSKDGVYRGIVKTPSGDLAYRYTVNSTDTKIPVGVISGDDNNIVNDNSWTDPGSLDPNKTQGDLKFLVDGKVTISYTARCFNEQGSLNQIQFWLAKNTNNVFTEVPNSKTATTIESQRTKPKMVTSFKFSFDVKANETYRMFAKSDKDDGFYLQSDLDGVPLFRLDIEFDEFTTTEKEIFEKTNEIKFVKSGQEVYDKILEYDVDTGRMKVIDKL